MIIENEKNPTENNLKTIVITGASDGIGAAAARQLSRFKHNVIIVGRSEEKTRRMAQELKCPFHIADFSRLSEVVRLADELGEYPHIDCLINNAGAMMKERIVTEDGIEKTFQVNCLGGFLLTKLLLEKLSMCHATVVWTSSIAVNLFTGRFDINDLQNMKHYTPIKAYSEAKLCSILLMREFNRRNNGSGINFVSVEPGVPRSNFASEAPGLIRFAYHSPLKYLFTISLNRSAERLTRLVLGTPGRNFISGETYSHERIYKVKFKDDGEIAEKLWSKCEKMVKDLK